MSKNAQSARKRGGRADKKTDHQGERASEDQALDEGLEESFPGSDPLSVTQPSGNKDGAPAGKK